MTNDTVGLIFVDERSPRYPEFVAVKENLISCGADTILKHWPNSFFI